ncbi:MAG: hypothetical protein PHO34_04950 [Candidatus Omnitrophica bacterium]|nr:hypothetical protein [Candidatus Omnitrophota bacterium]MDD5500305.1 hypothetical protein [Candidatus Omnitrophota bacterium]
MDIVLKEQKGDADGLWGEGQCRQLFRKWKYELDENEKQVWLWNSMVAMKRILERRGRRGQRPRVTPCVY